MKQLAVVIAAGSGQEPVLRCLRSLAAAAACERCEIIVAAPAPLELPACARLLVVAAERSYAALRAAGLAAARAPLVAILSEDYTVDAAWLARALAVGETDVVAGVTVAPAGASLAARAAWLWEYSHMTGPLVAGRLDEDEASQAPGGNVVYKRNRIPVEILATAPNELRYHRLLHAVGVRFRRDPTMVAAYHPPPFAQFVRDRARWSAAWARSRACGLSAHRRRIAAASRILLPPLLLFRFARRFALQPRRWLVCLAALPLFAVFACAQAVGEAGAYLEHG